MNLCQVCSQVDKKYNCPHCGVNYCSVSCFKVHNCKETAQNAPAKFVIDKDPSSELSQEQKDYLYEVPEDFILAPEVLQKLENSQELKDLLQNHHLRDLLKFVHETFNPSGFMKLAMREPLFVEFADACLKVIHPDQYPQNELTDQEIVQKISDAIEDRD